MTYQLQFHHFEHPMNLDCRYLKSQTPQDLRHSIMTGPLVCPQSQFVRSHHYHLEKKHSELEWIVPSPFSRYERIFKLHSQA